MPPKTKAVPVPGFFDAEESIFIDSFLEHGYAIVPLAGREALDAARKRMYARALELLGRKGSKCPALETFFDHTERFVPVEKLNAFRLGMIEHLNGDALLRPAMYRMARRHIEWAVGNEVAMQRTINLSIQLPKDASSLLPLHSDVWSGNSPYELVLWLPLVDCFKTKSMYILPRPDSEKIFREFSAYKNFDAEKLFQAVKPKLVWLDVPYGRALLFSHSLLHGNRVNDESTTRWTFNVRLKGLFTPYGVKELGESFLPATIRPATRIGFGAVSLEK
ncbi:MAG: sporadic carbohydrate cluster 2OG-Fe(II) oxygenase [Elusimicrobiota bacterium]